MRIFYESDYLLGVHDQYRVGALRYQDWRMKESSWTAE